MENPFKMDDLGGKPTIFGNSHINSFPNKEPKATAKVEVFKKGSIYWSTTKRIVQKKHFGIYLDMFYQFDLPSLSKAFQPNLFN